MTITTRFIATGADMQTVRLGRLSVTIDRDSVALGKEYAVSISLEPVRPPLASPLKWCGPELEDITDGRSMWRIHGTGEACTIYQQDDSLTKNKHTPVDVIRGFVDDGQLEF